MDLSQGFQLGRRWMNSFKRLSDESPCAGVNECEMLAERKIKTADGESFIPLLPLQVSSMDFMALKRSQLYGMANNPYSTAQQPGGGPYPPSQPYTSPPPHRYPMSMQGRGQMSMGGMQYPQQQVSPRTQKHAPVHMCVCVSHRGW